ncbi:hypothetical protein A9404_01370 [Halothiobacillus diazotrophicus]|uniref:Glutamyl/glutaminyl-tRNA synthetase class Ib catalytic domain-containing protein n=1 Tax=Halothiobacillus diazotrophicus TaxID=1860122 RepID=A0A191ZEA8_9GAMM|nr:tRNA glutamyl-Q(34) synthetase GluQRS [Halothiobacillus diazotrophicus]ANJ66202.1 hypothetical protein A9404_01370 [Halothiobacillus diazotrophicus]
MTQPVKCSSDLSTETRHARPYVGRFAPTPSGPLHQGSLVAALGSYLDAKAHDGLWRLRMDNLDPQRCRTDTESTIIEQLAAHGLHHDGPIIRQADRCTQYRTALRALQQQDAIYRCCCRRNTLRAGVDSGRIAEGLAGPIYPGTCRRDPPSADTQAGWRFSVPEEEIDVPDRRLGHLRQRVIETVGDPLLQRSDGVFAYHLAEVVDNAEEGITDVVRGADLAPLTPLHVAIHRSLYPDRPPPRYLHLPVLYDAEGRKLSKTNLAPPLDPRIARDNLVAAAQALGLDTTGAGGDPAALLQTWTDQWRALFLGGEQTVDPLESARQ